MSETNDWERFSVMGARVLFRGLSDTIRLANGPAELIGVLGAFAKAALWRPNASSVDERDQTLRLHGVTHVLGLRSGELFTPVEIYQDHVYDRLPDFLTQPGWVVMDVGANAGVYSVQQARRGAQVYAFEPNPDCYRRLRKAVTANDLDGRVIATNCAIGASAGSADLRVPRGLTTMGSLRPEWTPREGEERVTVKIETVDRMVCAFGISRVDLLKIDVEGLELDVLQGAREALARVDRVAIEYHSLELGRRVVEFITERGLMPVLDEPLYRGDESKYKGVGRGVVFACRRGGESPPIRPL